MSDESRVEMTLTKSTKGTHVYSASTQEGQEIIPTLYIRKEALDVQPPEHITIHIEVGGHE
tara:strand:+ start:33 stop:215 length:183 start_codon:yes stop_codon:yes gene_type:complete